jgi:hypothetical protein
MAKHYVLVVGSNAIRIETQGGPTRDRNASRRGK